MMYEDVEKEFNRKEKQLQEYQAILERKEKAMGELVQPSSGREEGLRALEEQVLKDKAELEATTQLLQKIHVELSNQKENQAKQQEQLEADKQKFLVIVDKLDEEGRELAEREQTLCEMEIKLTEKEQSLYIKEQELLEREQKLLHNQG